MKQVFEYNTRWMRTAANEIVAVGLINWARIKFNWSDEHCNACVCEPFLCVMSKKKRVGHWEVNTLAEKANEKEDTEQEWQRKEDDDGDTRLALVKVKD